MVEEYGVTFSLSFYSALAVYARSPAAFKALKSLDILQMPGRASLKAILSSNTQKPGICMGYICEQKKCYDQHCDQESMSEKPKPVGEGVLVFDEVKVQNGVNRMLYLYCISRVYYTLVYIYRNRPTPFFQGRVYMCTSVYIVYSNDLMLTIS